jgi:glycosyltransferase involved in cell wall biosynthesis
MRTAVFVVPGSLTALTGGSIYDRRMVEGLRSRGWRVEVHELDSSFPEPSSGALAEAGSLLSTIADDEVVVIDGLAFGAMPDVLKPHHRRLNLVAIVHMPLDREVGIDAAVADRRRGEELGVLRIARAVIATGRATVDVLNQTGHANPAPVLIEPGCDIPRLARGSESGTVRLLCVAAATPGKGHEALFQALAGVHGDWALRCVGSLTRDTQTANRLAELVESSSLRDRVSLTGELMPDQLAVEYDRADVFVLNTRFETYGMAVSEAIAHGLPVISTRTGAVSDLVGTEAGLVVAVGDEAALRAALVTMVTDAQARARYREGAARARSRLQSWDVTVDRLAAVLDAIPRHA